MMGSTCLDATIRKCPKEHLHQKQCIHIGSLLGHIRFGKNVNEMERGGLDPEITSLRLFRLHWILSRSGMIDITFMIRTIRYRDLFRVKN